jgi:hypothetical protein
MLTNFSIRSLALRSLGLALVMLALSTASPAQFRVAITFGPPALPVYEQPICPGEGYIWTPGYWYWDDDGEDYYWVPGTWVLAPEVGFLWTPGWWGWGGDVFVFHEGFWGPEVGFYGGVVYGFGYFGEGYEGGRWENGRFFYNRTVNNVDVTIIHNVYNTTVVNNTTINRVSYNGGNGGINRSPSPREQAAERQRHLPPVPVQSQHVQAARSNRDLHASVNQGKPPIAATPRPGALNDRGVVRAREAGAPYHPPANRGAAGRPGNQPAARPENGRAENNRPANNGSRPGNIVHPKDIPPAEHRPAPNTGNAKVDQKYQKQQEKMYAQQDRERQKLQQKQDQEHQRYTQRSVPEARTQQLEQRHQQQTQQLQQKHEAQQQRMQQRQPPPRQTESKPPKGK